MNAITGAAIFAGGLAAGLALGTLYGHSLARSGVKALA
jgi:hypothetical protein